MLKRILTIAFVSLSFQLAYSNKSDFLTSDLWNVRQGEVFFDYGGRLIFNKNMTFKSESNTSGEDPHEYEGSYSINNNILSLSYIYYALYDCNGNPNCKNVKKINVLCNKLNNLPFIFESYYLCNNGIVLYRNKDKAETNKVFILDNIKCIKTEITCGITTTNLKLRDKPSIESNYYKYTYSDKNENKVVSNFIPQNHKITILAKTYDKHKVDRWNNYWYLIDTYSHCSEFHICHGEKRFVWVFGEFISFHKIDKEDCYSNF